MRLIESKKVELPTIALWLRITNEAMMEYEEMTGESWPSFKTIKLRVQFIYCIAKAGAQAESVEFPYDYEAFWKLMNDYYFEVPAILEVILGMMPRAQSTGEKKA